MNDFITLTELPSITEFSEKSIEELQFWSQQVDISLGSATYIAFNMKELTGKLHSGTDEAITRLTIISNELKKEIKRRLEEHEDERSSKRETTSNSIASFI